MMTGFTFESVINDCGTEVSYRSYYDGIPCDHIKVDGLLAKRRSALELILSDICECLDIFELITFDVQKKYSKFLYKAFVITYGKCFASGEKRGTSLKAKPVFKGNEKLFQKHKQVIKTRNKYVAHSDSSNYEVTEVYLASFRNQSEVFTPTTKYSYPTGYSLVEEENLVIHVYEHIKEQISKIDNVILHQRCITTPNLQTQSLK